MNVLIIEDEPFAQQELMRLLRICDPGISVSACLDSVEESIRWLQSNPWPELIFMDIQLSDGLSFEIFNEIEVHAPVIFTTAFDEYAIRAFKVNSIDYLLKPIDEKELGASIGKFRKLREHFAAKDSFFSPAQLQEVLQLYKPAYKSRLLTRTGSQINHIAVDEIAYLYSEDKVTFVMTAAGKRQMLSYTLDQLERMLDPAHFYRLNRKYIARISAIGSVHKYFNSRLKIILKPAVDDEIVISRARVPEFLEWLEK
jgi:DNA-binding LytR/AlgR family response regulator